MSENLKPFTAFALLVACAATLPASAATGLSPSEFAGIHGRPKLTECPLNNNPEPLIRSIDGLFSSIQMEIALLEATDKRKGACASLSAQLESSRPLLSQAITQEASGADDPESQAQFLSLQRSSAIDQSVNTLSGILDKNCVGQGKKQLIQSLSTQILSLGGIALGGLPGIVATATGQVGGQVRFSKSPGEQGFDAARDFAHSIAATSFLCFYRTLDLRASYLMAPPGTSELAGFDVDYKEGSFTTEVRKRFYEFRDRDAERGKLVAEALMEEDLSAALTPEPKSGRVPFYSIARACDSVARDAGSRRDLFSEYEPRSEAPSSGEAKPYPQGLRELFLAVSGVCDRLHRRQIPTQNEQEQLEKTVSNLVIEARVFHDHGDIQSAEFRKARELAVGYRRIIDTCDQIKANVAGDRGGNELRLSVLDLARRMGRGPALDLFERLADQRLKAAADPRAFSVVRLRELFAAVDLCRTFDPTLAPLFYYEGERRDAPLMKAWQERCSGRGSPLCKARAGINLSSYPVYREYTDAACRRP